MLRAGAKIQWPRQIATVPSPGGNNDISPVFTNRNPRNLERLRISYKPDGYHVDRKGKCFWHNLRLVVTGRYATASVLHFENGEVVKASTQEWSLKKHLYRTTDTSAFTNLARIFAHRCLQSGITEMSCCDVVVSKEDGKIALFLKTLRENGVSLAEPPQFKCSQPWDQLRPDKPWEITE